MYGGVGLHSAKGTGTNGYIERALGYLPKDYKPGSYGEIIRQMKANPAQIKRKINDDIILHEEKHKIEVELYDLKEKYENEKKYTEDEINDKINNERKRLYHLLERREEDFMDKNETHQKGKLKDAQMKIIRDALKIKDGYYLGEGFEYGLQADMDKMLKQNRANNSILNNNNNKLSNHINNSKFSIKKNNSFYKKKSSANSNSNIINVNINYIDNNNNQNNNNNYYSKISKNSSKKNFSVKNNNNNNNNILNSSKRNIPYNKEDLVLLRYRHCLLKSPSISNSQNNSNILNNLINGYGAALNSLTSRSNNKQNIFDLYMSHNNSMSKHNRNKSENHSGISKNRIKSPKL